MVRAEQDIQSPNQELPKGEVVFSKQLTLRELLNIKPGEEGEAEDLANDVRRFPFKVGTHHFRSLLIISPGTQETNSGEEGEPQGPINDIPFNFEVRDLGDSLLHIVDFSATHPVSLEELFPLLQAAKPGGVSRRGSQDIDGISADWRIILPEVRGKEPNSKELYDFHKKYVPEFSEFEANHFGLFWKVLESGNRRKEEVEFFDHQLNQFIDEREFFAKYGRGQDFSNNPFIVKNFPLAHIKSFKQFLEEKGFNILPNSGPKDSDPFRETRELFYSMNEQEQRALGIEFYKKSVDKGGIAVERRLGSYLRWLYGVGYPGITTLIGKDDELNRIDYTGRLKPLGLPINEGDSLSEKADSFRKLDNGQIELKRGESFVRLSIVEGEDGYKKVKLEDHRLYTAESMVPLIIWQTDKQTGKRSYYCRNLDQFPKHDTLLGQLVVAAYSPKVRDQMPPEIKMKVINGEEKTQQMLEAQTVLLVPRFANKFLTQSSVILGFEALAKNPVN